LIAPGIHRGIQTVRYPLKGNTMSAASIRPFAIIALSAVSLSAFASTYNGSCTSEPKAKWMVEKDVQTMYEKQGYTVRRIKSAGTCYEVYTIDRNGRKVELFVSPADGHLIQEAGKS
jgi:hypothetical protein